MVNLVVLLHVLSSPWLSPTHRASVITEEALFNPTGTPTQLLLVVKVVNIGGRLSQTFILP